MQLGTLHSNNIKNIEGKYKVLENVLGMDVVVSETEHFWLRDYLLKLTIENNKVYTVIE